MMERQKIIEINRIIARNLAEQITGLPCYRQQNSRFHLDAVNHSDQFEKGKTILGNTGLLTYSGECGEIIKQQINQKMLMEIPIQRDREFFELMDYIPKRIWQEIESQRWEYILKSKGITGSDVISQDKFKEIFIGNVGQVFLATVPLPKRFNECTLCTTAEGFNLRVSYDMNECLFEISIAPVFYKCKLSDDQKIFID